MAISKPKPGRVVKEPVTNGGDGLIVLCEDLLRIIVQINGGFPSTPGFAREIVRTAREMYSEIDKPTERKPVKQGVIVNDPWEGEEEDDYGR